MAKQSKKLVRARNRQSAMKKARSKTRKVVNCKLNKGVKKYHGMKQYTCTMAQKKNTRGWR
jgi:hypothetical protein